MKNNIEIFKTQVAPFSLKKEKVVKIKGVYERLINWVSGEFDLYLQTESKFLKVYFPNGWFSIINIKVENSNDLIEIKVEGKSRKACQKIMNELESIYNHVIHFSK